MSDGNDGNSSNSITFTRTCVPYYIHVRKEFKKSGVITVIPVTDSRKRFLKKMFFMKRPPQVTQSLGIPLYKGTSVG